MTNAVKHFHFKPAPPPAGLRAGAPQRRLHQTPEARHVQACKPWLLAELDVLDPEVVVALGATAGRASLGPSFRVTRQRGQLIPWPDAAIAASDSSLRHRAAWLVPTVHPSAVLRADDRDAAYAGLVADLRAVAGLPR